MREREPQVDVVIVSWNAGPALWECVASLGQAGVELGRVIVVDNASSDGSIDGLEACAGAAGVPLTVVRNARNRGFGPACNQGARMGAAEHVLFLNPDARLEAGSLPGSLAELAEPANADVGVLGIELRDADGHLARSCARFPGALTYLWIALGLDRLGAFAHKGYRMTDWDHASTRDVDHVMGAFYLMRRAAFDAVGGFDERFFVYFEDLDLSRRVRASGRRVRYVAGPRAFHAGGGTTRAIPARRLAYFLRGKLRYARKHHGPATFAFAALTTLVLEPLARVLGALVRGRLGEARAAVGGYALLLLGEPRASRAAVGGADVPDASGELRSRAHG
jgi:hypothetical protein